MAGVIDPSGFQMSARMITSDGGQVFNLWLGGGEGRGAGVNGGSGGPTGQSFFTGGKHFQDIPIVASIDTEIGLGNTGKITVNVQADYNLGLALLESHLFVIGNKVEVQLGYPKAGVFTPWYGGITAKPSIRISPDEGLMGSLNVEGASFSAVRVGSCRQYTNKTYMEIVREIATRHGWDVIADPETLATDSAHPMNQRRNMSQGNMTDWRTIQYVTRRGDCDAWIAPSQVQVGRTALFVRSRTVATRPKVRFNARGQCNFIDVFPLLTFESGSEGVWLPRGAGTIRIADIDPTTREEVSVEVAPESTDAARTAEATVGDASVETADMNIQPRAEANEEQQGERGHHSPVGQGTQGEVATSRSNEQQARGGIQGTMSAIGIPHVGPGDFIEIINIGIFSGNYGILNVAHRAEPGMWTSTYTLLSNALVTGAIAENFRSQVSNVNDEPAEVTEEAEGGGTEVVPEEGADT